MAAIPSPLSSIQQINTSEALKSLLQSFGGLSNDPASFYLSMGSRNLVIYVAPLGSVNLISLRYLTNAVQQGNRNAYALKNFLETDIATKVFFDARTPAKFLFDRCGIKLANPVRPT